MTPMSWVISITAMRSRSRSPSIRSRIWAWIVTSRAVVGSSAMSSLGSQASAMAIITRWRSPPDSSWGYWSSRSAGRGISTMVRTSSARLRASPLETSRCSRTPSAICLPIVIVGLSEVSGSWGISATSSPRTVRICFSSRGARSRPSSRTLPPLMWPLPGNSRMIEKPAVLFPQPDSPTTPTHSPSATEKEMPSTAVTVAWRIRNSVRRSDTSSTLVTGEVYRSGARDPVAGRRGAGVRAGHSQGRSSTNAQLRRWMADSP